MAATPFLLHGDAYPFASNVSFDRDETTVDPSGAAVAADEPRFDHNLTLASISTPEPVFSSLPSPPGIALASGVAADGTTEIMVWLHRAQGGDPEQVHALYTFVGGGVPSSLPSQGSAMPSPHQRKLLTKRWYFTKYPEDPEDDKRDFYDVFSDSDTRPQTPEGLYKAYEIVDAAVFHGAIVLACQVYIDSAESPGNFTIAGFGFLWSFQKSGFWESWDLIGDDVSDSPGAMDQVGWPRGAPWCLRAAPVYQRGTSHPDECWFSGTDYRRSVTVDSADRTAQKGRAYVFKINRTYPGVWAKDELNWFDISETLTHVHASQITEYFNEEETGIQMIVSIGDSQDHNRYIRYLLPDITDDYTDDGNWVKTDPFHGRYAQSGDHGSWSGQPASVCFGANSGLILWGTDTTHDWIIQMQAPMTATGQAKFKHIYGMRWCSWDVNPYSLVVQLSTMKDQRPELAGGETAPAAAILYGIGVDAAFNRVFYTPRISDQVDTWCQVASADGGETAVVYGDYIYWNRQFGTTPFNRVVKPQIARLRPILVAPGGINLAKSDCDYLDEDPDHNTVGADVDKLSEDPLNPGVYLDPTGSISLPRVPCLPAAVFRVVTDRAETIPSGRPASAGQIQVSKHGSAALVWNTGGISNVALVRRWRAWVLDGTFGQSSSFTPNKTTSLTLSALDTIPTTNAAVKYSCSDRWCPLPSMGQRSIVNSPFEFPLDLIGSDSGIPSDDNYFYLAIAEALDGPGSLPYPLAPTAGSSNPTTPAPDEHLRVTGLTLSTTHHWQLRVVGMHPIGNWDHFASRGSYSGITYTSNRRWPLFHLYDSGGTTIQFMADCESLTYLVRIRTTAGATDHFFSSGLHYWMPDAPLMVAIAYDATLGVLIVGVSLGGDRVRTISIPTPFGIATPSFTELRFRATSAEAVANEVVEFRWFGGDYDDNLSVAPTETGVASAFENLSFLGE